MGILLEFKNAILVGLGSFLGGFSRYIFSLIIPNSHLPFDILFVNVFGSFLIGLLFPGLREEPSLRLFFLTGVLGGFTTFSAFSLGVNNLYAGKNGVFVAFLYVFLSVTLSILATYLGLVLVKKT